MSEAWIPPGLVLIAGAFALPFAGGRARAALVTVLPVATLCLVWLAPEGLAATGRLFAFDTAPVKSDALGRLFATVFSLMALAGGVYALGQKSRFELAFAYAYAGSAVGVAMAGDVITLFVFWELMAVTSTGVVLAGGTQASRRAALRYFTVHMLGGALLLAGLVMHIAATGSTAVAAFDPSSPGGALVLAGVLINAAAPPLSAWLADAYPEASYTGTVFLSAFTTKTAVYVLLRSFAGTDVLIYVGLFMIFYGIVYALLENDMRRILAYSIVNQVGFMVTGAGIGTEMALNGAASHAFAHILYKALLLMSAGSVLYATGRRKCTDLGGLFQSMPVTCVCGIVGALAISSFPWTSGFVSKSMVSDAAGTQGMTAVWLALMAASAGVFLHAGIKFPWFVFFQKDSGLRPPDPPLHMRAAMIALAVACVGLGVFPQPLYALLPYPVSYEPYTLAHVVNMLQLLLFAGLAFFVLLPLMKRTLTISLDFDWFYRVLGVRAGRALGDLASRARAAGARHARAGVDAATGRAALLLGTSGRLAPLPQSSRTVLSVLALLLAALAFGVWTS